MPAQIANYEELVGLDFALVNALHPILDGHLDAEPLVDFECQVKERQAIYAEVTHQMTFRLDIRLRNVCIRSNDFRDGVESCAHLVNLHLCQCELGMAYQGGRASVLTQVK